ncbi:DUF3331 domain-containing protein [Paraburkholderia terrae]|uniref:DUF3331 domain-containing protein n=1 Tax=Paraburkholderia terrae TaxID=311230 RepID=UPI00296B2F52|nr:DUF3331 domain-containing protein [Paraburkholderia terrae]MDW3656518.1 DUF3331 domain-containing protein [Paraburkholderia terrae]
MQPSTIALTRSSTTEDNIIERVLLRLLLPETVPATEPIETAYKKKKRRKALPVVRPVHRADWTPRPARLLVHEILTSHTLSICWSDSQTGHYAEQVWRLGLARNDGYCALSGRPIVEGDEVFRPRRSAVYVPANWNRMILASQIKLEAEYA